MSEQRVVITGMGWVTPLGYDIDEVWQRMMSCDSGVDRTTHFDASTFPTNFCAEVKDYDYTQYVDDPSLHDDVGRNTAYALGAATQAWRMAGLKEGAIDPARLGIYLGSGEGVLDVPAYVEAAIGGWDAEAREVDTAKWTPLAHELMNFRREVEQEPNMPMAHIAMEFNAQGPAYNCLTACAASTQAIGEASEILRRGDADVMITGGAHTMIHLFGITGFNRLTALSNRNDSPQTASRPFTVDRDGFVIGEGAGMLILETLEHAEARGAKPLAEIAGYGSTADAFRITDMHPEGRGAAGAMRQAMAQAGVTESDIDYISAHGTGTKENDSIETKAIKSVFAEGGDVSKVPPVSSIKSMTGHLIAAAGVTEAIVCALAIQNQTLPPTANLHEQDPDLDLDYVPNAPREAKVDVCLSNSFGFGGQNDTLIVKRV